MYVRTDASVKNKRSTHSFTVYSPKGKIMYNESFKGFDEDSTRAEMTTIIKVLQFLNNKGFNNVNIITDCKSISDAINSKCNMKNIDISYLKFLINITRSKIRWQPRKRNKKCDAACKDVVAIFLKNNRFGKKGMIK